MDIQITESAQTRLRETAENEGIDLSRQWLRIGVVSGGCSGLTYELGWDTVKKEKDREFEIGGLRVLLDLQSFLYLAGTTLDFSAGLDGKGFHFQNPQASRTCACGESFAV
jgi:iron-sulfur cluster assembly protein